MLTEHLHLQINEIKLTKKNCVEHWASVGVL